MRFVIKDNRGINYSYSYSYFRVLNYSKCKMQQKRERPNLGTFKRFEVFVLVKFFDLNFI